MSRYLTAILTLTLVVSMTGLCSAQGDTERAERLLYLSQKDGPFSDSAAHYLKKLDTFADQQGLLGYRLEANYNLGKHYLLRLNTPEAKYYFRQSAVLAAEQDNYEMQGFALDRLGLTHLREEMTDSALMCFQQSIDIYKQHGFDHRIWASLQGMSRVFQNRNDYERAKAYGDQALASIEGLDEEVARTVLLDHMMTLARAFNNFEDQTYYHDKYLETLEPHELGKDGTHYVAYFTVGDDPRERIIEINKALEKLLETPPTLSLLSGYFRLGDAYLELEDYASAIDAWKEGLRIDASVGGKGYALIFTNSLADAYAAYGQFQEAFAMSRRSQQISDSIQTAENARVIEELQVQYETAQKEQTILAQQVELQQNARQRSVLMFVGGLVLALGLMIIYVLRTRLKTQKIIAEQEIENLKQSNRLDMLNAILKGQEEERKRIAYDLHDGLGGLLSTVKHQFQKIYEQHGLERLNGEATKANKMLDEACSEVRRIAHNMMPHALLKMGLHEAIDDMVGAMSKSSDVEIDYENLMDTRQLNEEQKVMLYRIIQELVNNAIKHAQPNSILVQLSSHNDSLTLMVEDDGIGFDKESVEQGLGLQSLDSRVQFLNGTWEIDSTPNTGTTVAIEVPLKPTQVTVEP